MRTEKEIENLLVVYAVEGYAHKHNLSTLETFQLFKQYGVNGSIRKCYGGLHTEDLDESVDFSGDVLARRIKEGGGQIQ